MAEANAPKPKPTPTPHKRPVASPTNIQHLKDLIAKLEAEHIPPDAINMVRWLLAEMEAGGHGG